MNKAILVIVFLFLLAGCAKEQDLTEKSGPAALVQKEGKESGKQVALPVAVVPEMQAPMKKAQEQAALVEPAAGAKEIIAASRWGFSAYDPQTGIEEFYTSSGALLGSKKKQAH